MSELPAQRHCRIIKINEANHPEGSDAINQDDALTHALSQLPFDACTLISADPLLTGCAHTAKTLLGQDVERLIYDAREGVEANALGQMAGTVVAGGVLMIIVHEHDHSPMTERLLRFAVQHKVGIDEVSAQAVYERILTTIKATHPQTEFKASREQDDVLQGLLRLNSGSAMVVPECWALRAPRGRGKSSLMGRWLHAWLADRQAEFAADGDAVDRHAVVVIAPSKQAAQTLLKHANVRSSDPVKFYAIDAFLSLNTQTQHNVQCLLVDEAAAMPASLMRALVNCLSTQCHWFFASSSDGYEGSGQAFKLQLPALAKEQGRDYREYNLHTAIRWSSNDALERYINGLLLLDGAYQEGQAAVTETLEHKRAEEACEEIKNEWRITRIEPSRWATDEALLVEAYQLLKMAHYQTQCAELQALIEGRYMVHALWHKAQMIGLCTTMHEGGMSVELAEAICAGTRRPKGHLVAQTLCAHLGIVEGCVATTERVTRVAVAASWRRQGVASALITHVMHTSVADSVSVSFGLRKSLYSFWQAQGFKAVFVGHTRNKSSGRHSMAMMLAITERGGHLQHRAEQQFARLLHCQLNEQLAGLDEELKVLLVPLSSADLVEDKSDAQRLHHFSYAQVSYDNAMPALQVLCKRPSVRQFAMANLSPGQWQRVQDKIIAQQKWPSYLLAHDGLTGRSMALAELRESVATMLGLSAG